MQLQLFRNWFTYNWFATEKMIGRKCNSGCIDKNEEMLIVSSKSQNVPTNVTIHSLKKNMPLNTLYFKCALKIICYYSIATTSQTPSPIERLLRCFWAQETTPFIVAFNHSKITRCSHCSSIWITWARPTTSLHVCHPLRNMNPRWLNPKKQSRTIQSLICMEVWRTSPFQIAPERVELVWWKGISLWLQSLQDPLDTKHNHFLSFPFPHILMSTRASLRCHSQG